MIKAPYDRKRNYDIIYEKIIKGISKTLIRKDDDYVMLYAGATGSGKSNLMLWGYELFDPEGCDHSFIGLDRQTHAVALKNAADKKQPRFCADDEANVSKRDAMTKYNRQRIDLYLAIRGLNIFHAWCNPSVEMLDKAFIEERIKGMVYVLTKDVDRPRVYYYFTKKGILKMLEDCGNLKQKTIKDNGEKYAYYKGWFRKYEGNLLKPYLAKKEDRMSTKVTEFFEEYGEAWMNASTIAKKLKVTPMTIKNRHDVLIKENLIFLDDHYRINETTQYIEWNEAGFDIIRDYKNITFGGKARNINTHAFDLPKNLPKMEYKEEDKDSFIASNIEV